MALSVKLETIFLIFGFVWSITMIYKIVTNNQKVREFYKDTLFVDGTFIDVLIKVRNLIHEGYELISHPLAASIRMMFSPYRSIIVGGKLNHINSKHIEIIENCINKYRNTMQNRKPDMLNCKDYALIDFDLTKSSIVELKSISINQNGGVIH